MKSVNEIAKELNIGAEKVQSYLSSIHKVLVFSRDYNLKVVNNNIYERAKNDLINSYGVIKKDDSERNDSIDDSLHRQIMSKPNHEEQISPSSPTQIFEQYLNVLELLNNDLDLYVYPQIPNNVKAKARANFHLGLDEEILFVRDTSFFCSTTQGLVLTNEGITFLPDNDNLDEFYDIKWHDINSAEFKDGYIYIFGYGSRDNHLGISIEHFLKNMDNSRIDVEISSIFVELITQISQLFDPEDLPIAKAKKKYDELYKAGAYNDALAFAIESSNQFEEEGCEFNLMILKNHYLKENQFEEALLLCDEEIKKYMKTEGEYLYYLVELHYYRSIVHKGLSNYKSMRSDSFYVIENSRDIQIKEESKKNFAISENFYIDKFLDIPYNQRKLLLPTDKYTNLEQRHISIVKIQNLPKVSFPIGHPIAYQLYIGHPHLANKYIPFVDYEFELIEDKLREFCQIMQSLGALSITIDSNNTNYRNSDTSTQENISGESSYTKFKTKGDYLNKNSSRLLERISQTLNLHQKYIPQKLPKLPERLVWYPNEPSWQRLYEQRMQGGLLRHEEKIESRKTKVVSGSEIKQIEAELNMILLNAKGKYDFSMEEKIESEENVILSIHIDFAPLDSIYAYPLSPSISQQENPILAEEQEYIDEYNSCLEEGSGITDGERRLLNKIRIKLGISEERAFELEKNNYNKFTTEEEEYLEEYKLCLEDGNGITDGERRLLNKIRIKLGISDERIREIESYVN